MEAQLAGRQSEGLATAFAHFTHRFTNEKALYIQRIDVGAACGVSELFCIHRVVSLGPAGRRNVRCCVLWDYVTNKRTDLFSNGCIYITRLASAKLSLSKYSPSLGQSLFWTTAPNSASSFYTSLPNSAVRGPQIPHISIILRTGSSVESQGQVQVSICVLSQLPTLLYRLH